MWLLHRINKLNDNIWGEYLRSMLSNPNLANALSLCTHKLRIYPQTPEECVAFHKAYVKFWDKYGGRDLHLKIREKYNPGCRNTNIPEEWAYKELRLRGFKKLTSDRLTKMGVTPKTNIILSRSTKLIWPKLFSHHGEACQYLSQLGLPNHTTAPWEELQKYYINPKLLK